MEGTNIFRKLIKVLSTPEADLIRGDHLLKGTLQEIFDFYEQSSKKMTKLFERKYAQDVDGRILILQNLFLHKQLIEFKLKMKQKQKYKSILIWLIDKINDTNHDYVSMIGRAVGVYGSILSSIRTEKTVMENMNITLIIRHKKKFMTIVPLFQPLQFIVCIIHQIFPYQYNFIFLCSPLASTLLP